MYKKTTPPQSKGQVPVRRILIVQHNSLGSWDVFLLLFGSLVGAIHSDILLLQDPPSSKGFLPRFTGPRSFAPPSPRPKVAIHVSIDFCSRYAVLPGFHDITQDTMHLDIHHPAGYFRTSALKFRISNIHARQGPNHSPSVPPEVAFSQLDLPYLVAGDFNIHNPSTDPSRIFSYSEDLATPPFHTRASDLGLGY